MRIIETKTKEVVFTHGSMYPVGATAASIEAAADRAEAAATDAGAAADRAALYDGPRVDTFAQLADISTADWPVGGYAQVRSLNQWYQRVSGAASSSHILFSNGRRANLADFSKGVDPRVLGAPANGIADDAPFAERAFTISKKVTLTPGDHTYRFSSVIGLPFQSIQSDDSYALYGGGTLLVDGVAAGDAILTSADAKADPESTGNPYVGKIRIFGLTIKPATAGTASTLINGDRCYNVIVEGNQIGGLDALIRSYRDKAGHAEGYLQSVFIQGNHFHNMGGIIRAKNAYNISFCDNQCESNQGDGIVIDGITRTFTCNNIRIERNLWEDGGQFVRVGNTIGGIISGNYMENNRWGSMLTSKCHYDLRINPAIPSFDQGQWRIEGNTGQDFYVGSIWPSGQVADPDFCMFRWNGDPQNVTGGGNWTNTKLSLDPMRSTLGYARGQMDNGFNLPRSEQSQGGDAIGSSLLRPLSFHNEPDLSKFRFMTLNLGSSPNATDYRETMMDLMVKMEAEVATGEVFASMAFNCTLLFSPVGSGVPGSAGKFLGWSLAGTARDLVQIAAGENVNTSAGASTYRMIPSGTTPTIDFVRSGNFIHVRCALVPAATIPGYGAITAVRTHIVGRVNARSKNPGTAARWFLLAN